MFVPLHFNSLYSSQIRTTLLDTLSTDSIHVIDVRWFPYFIGRI